MQRSALRSGVGFGSGLGLSGYKAKFLMTWRLSEISWGWAGAAFVAAKTATQAIAALALVALVKCLHKQGADAELRLVLGSARERGAGEPGRGTAPFPLVWRPRGVLCFPPCQWCRTT